MSDMGMKELTIKVGERDREYDLGFSGRYIGNCIDRSLRYELKLYAVRNEKNFLLIGQDDHYTLVQSVSDNWLIENYPDLARLANLSLVISLRAALYEYPLNLNA